MNPLPVPDAYRLPGAIHQAILSLAKAHAEEEVCGLLGGDRQQACNWYPVPNVAPDRRRRFLLDPAAQIAAMRAMRDRGERLSAIFHSHPDGSPAPSVADRHAASYADLAYLIAAPQADRWQLHGWWFDGRSFLSLPLTD